MKILFLAILFSLTFCFRSVSQQVYGLVIHGGAGNITRENNSGKETEYQKALDSALSIGYTILNNGGSAVDAVEATVKFMEDCPLFNAGKGAVFTAEGRNELDASIMDGKNLKAGAVAGTGTIKNPISAARLVMDKSPHVMLTGKGACEFAQKNGLEMVDSSYFKTEESWQRYLKSKEQSKHGTVGCVALDKEGNIAAGTSTGGMMMKKYGRVGDSPVIGAGTYANNKTCGVSCTGHGEFFIRYAVAFNIHALMDYKGFTVKQASDSVIHGMLSPVGGTGGVIVLDAKGNYAFSFNTSGMFRGVKLSNGSCIIKMYE
jgi:beta-aspartyl-peptidase (threonine type)